MSGGKREWEVPRGWILSPPAYGAKELVVGGAIESAVWAEGSIVLLELSASPAWMNGGALIALRRRFRRMAPGVVVPTAVRPMAFCLTPAFLSVGIRVAVVGRVPQGREARVLFAAQPHALQVVHYLRAIEPIFGMVDSRVLEYCVGMGLLDGSWTAPPFPPRVLQRTLRDAGLPSPRRMIACGRALRASSLLQQRIDSTIANVALQVGYSEQPALSAAIRRAFGRTPAEVRANSGWEWLVARWVDRMLEAGNDQRILA